MGSVKNCSDEFFLFTPTHIHVCHTSPSPLSGIAVFTRSNLSCLRYSYLLCAVCWLRSRCQSPSLYSYRRFLFTSQNIFFRTEVKIVYLQLKSIYIVIIAVSLKYHHFYKRYVLFYISTALLCNDSPPSVVCYEDRRWRRTVQRSRIDAMFRFGAVFGSAAAAAAAAIRPSRVDARRRADLESTPSLLLAPSSVRSCKSEMDVSELLLLVVPSTL